MWSVYVKTFNIGIAQDIIDIQFYSHKDNNVLDMVKTFNEIEKMDENSVIFQPELFIDEKLSIYLCQKMEMAIIMF